MLYNNNPHSRLRLPDLKIRCLSNLRELDQTNIDIIAPKFPIEQQEASRAHKKTIPEMLELNTPIHGWKSITLLDGWGWL